MTIRVKVIPRSAKSEIVGEMPDGTLKVRISAPPEKGKANAALCALLSKHYGKSATVISGHTAPIKLIRLD
jgi:uncharacterized protein (TIGR00251 family)